MKTLKTSVLAALILLFFISCKTFKKDSLKSPEGVAVKFLTSMSRLDFEEAKHYGTLKTGQLLDVFIMAMAAAKKNDSTFKAEKKEVDIVILKCEKQGDFAVVYYSSGDKKEDRIDLVKQDGRWLVDLKKESPQLKNFQPKIKQ